MRAAALQPEIDGDRITLHYNRITPRRTTQDKCGMSVCTSPPDIVGKQLSRPRTRSLTAYALQFALSAEAASDTVGFPVRVCDEEVSKRSGSALRNRLEGIDEYMSAEDKDHTNASEQVSDNVVLLIVALYAASFVVFGFLVDTPAEIFRGLGRILTSRDTLLTDYIGVGGMGAAFVNAGLLTLCSSFVYYKSRAKMGGASVACLFLVLGFALFGKNLLNIWFIVAGVFLYSRFRNEPFATNINVAFFGVALAPIFSEILFSTSLPLAVSLPLSVCTSLLIGFILAPAAAQLFKAHMGFTLYNMGFTAGLVGTLVVALYKSYGFVPDPVFIWTTGNNLLLGGFLSVVFISMIAVGVYFDRGVLLKLKELMRLSGQAPTDFIAQFGIGPALANMGLAGAIGMAYILCVGGDLNGPPSVRYSRSSDLQRTASIQGTSSRS